jgi:dolichol-phosphate mannosyltransferase
LGAEGAAREGPAADDRGLPQVPLNPTLSVVVPCHNEEGNLPRYARELFPALDALGVPYEAVIVDDGSTDGTAAAAAALAAARGDVRLASLTPNRGLGAALRAGFAESRGEWIAALDADLTFRPETLKDMLAAGAAAGADMVCGSPYLRAADLASVPWARRLPSLMMNALYRGLFGTALTAYTPMFRLYRAAKLRELAPSSDGFEISAEIAARARQRRWKIVEVPAALETRVAGVSKLRRWRELSAHLRLIARLLFPSAEAR